MGQSGRRSLAASAAAVGLVTALAAAGTAAHRAAPAVSGPAVGGPTASGPTVSGPTVSPDAIFLKVIRPEQPFSTQDCQQQFRLDCYTPGQIQQAYSLPALYQAGITGQGTTVVVVDAFGSPTIASDLSEFDREANLPAATLNILRPVGHVPSYHQDSFPRIGWAGESTLDVEWAHAIAPGATIDLVEVPNGSARDLMAGVTYAVRHRLGDVISQSWGGAEQSFGKHAISIMHKTYAEAVKYHITVVAAAGDQGATQPTAKGYYQHPQTLYSATDPDVVAVGGTSLHLGSAGNKRRADTVWNDTYNQAVDVGFFGSSPPVPTATGGGYSTAFGRPSYQRAVKNIVGGWRGIPDISMSASCSGSVQVYQGFPPGIPGWDPVCGTSEAAPIFAGIVALADQKAGHSLGYINPVIYELAAKHAKGIVLVTSGNNTVAYSTGQGTSGQGTTGQQKVTVPGYRARHGYSLAAGVGTIDAKYFVPELAFPDSVKAPGHKKPPKKKPQSLCAEQTLSSRSASPVSPPSPPAPRQPAARPVSRPPWPVLFSRPTS